MTDKKVAEVFPPSEFIKEELEARNWSQVELAEIIGRHPKVVNDVITGKRLITPEIAMAFGAAFGTSAQYWMNLESAYQLWHAQDADNTISRRSRLYQIAPIKEMIKRHWLEKSERIEVLEQRVAKFFGINSINDPFSFPCAPRRRGKQEITPAQWAWIFRAQQLSRAVDAKPFTAGSFKEGLGKLKNILHSVDEVRHVPRILAESGIRLIVLEQLPHTKIDGITFWLNERSPVIALSMRYDRIDWFWYTLSHELGHVKRKDGLKHEIRLDTELVGNIDALSEPRPEAEREADVFASNFLINKSDLDDFIMRISPLYGQKKILGFAKRIGVHPGIVVGQLQFKHEIPWSSYRPMLKKVKHFITHSTLTDGWGQTPIFKEA